MDSNSSWYGKMQPPQLISSQEDHNIELNMNEICRLCRSPKGVMSYIFSSVGVDTTLPLSERIMSFVNVHMHEGDGLPSLICHRCLFHVEQISEFKIICQQSDAVLRQFLNLQNDDKTRKRKTECSPIPEYMEQPPLNGCEPDVIVKTEAGEEANGVGSDEEQVSSCSDSDENALHCSTCNKRFTLQAALERHNFIHTQEGPFPCDYCDQTMPDKALLRVHWRQVHASNKSYMCQTCGEAFKFRQNLLKHNVRHDKIKPFRCAEPSCQKAFAYRSDLRKHAVIHSGVRPYVCPVCFKAFTRSTNLNKHARVHNGSKPFPCGQCVKMFATRGDLMRHSLIHTGEKPYSCSVCFISFNRKDKLSRHEKLHNEQRAHVCLECPTSFNRKEDLTKHVQFHHYSTICGEEYNSANISAANPAMKLANGNGNIHLDGKGSEGSMEDDIKEQSETEDVVISVDPHNWAGTKFQCDVCSRLFKDSDELIKHRQTHEKSRNFICEVCRKGFHQRRELVRHALTHTGFKPHSCETCGKAFSRRDKLRRHERIHIVKKSCSVCAKNCHSPEALAKHLAASPCCKPFQCNHCSSGYSRKDKLVRHIKNEHAWALN